METNKDECPPELLKLLLTGAEEDVINSDLNLGLKRGAGTTYIGFWSQMYEVDAALIARGDVEGIITVIGDKLDMIRKKAEFFSRRWKKKARDIVTAHENARKTEL